MATHVIYPGSFDPFTNGHLNIVKKAAAVFDKVTILLACNLDKIHMFSETVMNGAIAECLYENGLKNCNVELYYGLLAEYCLTNDVKYIVRGLRNSMDYAYEENMAQVNKLLNPKIEYVYFRSDNPEISSSMVKVLLKNTMDVSAFVPPSVNDVLIDSMYRYK